METIKRGGIKYSPDCLPENQGKLTGHAWCPGYDICECECHESA